MFLILGLQCYSIYNARVTRTEFWKVKTTTLGLALTTVAVYSDFSVLKNNPVNLLWDRDTNRINTSNLRVVSS